jgi:hypothetical protein
MLNELALFGYNYADINEIHNQKTLEPKAVEIILRWLPAIYEDGLGSGEHLVRSLIGAKEEFNPEVLIDLFENSDYNETIKCTIAYVLAISKTYNIADWMLNELINKGYAFERSGLLFGLTTKASITSTGNLIEVLKKLFDNYWEFEIYLKLFKKYGRKDDIPFLESKIKNGNKKIKNEISKIIEAIQKRKNVPKFPISELKDKAIPKSVGVFTTFVLAGSSQSSDK